MNAKPGRVTTEGAAAPQRPAETSVARQERLERARADGAAAYADYEAEREATAQKTARLRALRLAKEAQDRARPPAPAKAGRRRPAGA